MALSRLAFGGRDFVVVQRLGIVFTAQTNGFASKSPTDKTKDAAKDAGKKVAEAAKQAKTKTEAEAKKAADAVRKTVGAVSPKAADKATAAAAKLSDLGKKAVAAMTPSETSVSAPKKPSSFDNWGDVWVPPGKLPPWPENFKEYPERDLVNFPHPVRTTWPPKVRLGFIPDSWFQFFYKKTGVTGPYLFGWGLVSFMLQKELMVYEHNLMRLPIIVLMAYCITKMAGADLSKMVNEENEKYMQTCQKNLDKRIHALEGSIKDAKNVQAAWAEIPKHEFPALKEEINLQLEANYRERLEQIYKEVKRRVDYMVESEAAKRRFEQRHMVNWIVDQVKKSITPQQEKLLLSQCINSLKNLQTS